MDCGWEGKQPARNECMIPPTPTAIKMGARLFSNQRSGSGALPGCVSFGEQLAEWYPRREYLLACKDALIGCLHSPRNMGSFTHVLWVLCPRSFPLVSFCARLRFGTSPPLERSCAICEMGERVLSGSHKGWF